MHSSHWHGTHHAIRSRRYHYVRYRDGGEELYDMSKDPNQWKNLTEDSKYEVAKEELKKWLPKINAAHYRAETPTER